MPVFQIVYTTPYREDVSDYVCPDGYDNVQALKAFERQNPSANVVTIIRVPEEIPA